MKDYSRRTYKEGEIIFSQNQRAGEAYLITSGKVRLEVDKNGEIKEIDTIGKGAMFGEMGVISDSNRMAAAVAVSDTNVLTCSRKEFHDRLSQLSKDRRDAVQFLILYAQELLPFELMENRPDGDKDIERDKIAYYLIKKADDVEDLDVFLKGLYKVLINYAERRIPPDFTPEEA
ncbi:cyclic nucleotide-binding domain-containing protein [Terasakiella sp. A23]|uniref:cyclic nucleotide-binding domain-containing protein n=1 Tax=Terasakiella sp. FCG-A23 TaxID=3080561 RepID=UPI002952F2CB|nr:cyclic nucleotide-binding domain-containing protein [Terasakiella sp. A23]MDV7338046.1 cyclic nucleotide-binding domain-containing protein [Terasakiella sp. A23]